MQLLAIGGSFVTFFSGVQGTIFSIFGIALVVSVGLYIAGRNNLFINISLNKLSKSIQKLNEKIKTCKRTNERNKLQEEKLALEKKLHAKLEKAYNKVKFSPKRLERLEKFIDKHVEKYPNFLNSFGDNVKNLKDLYGMISVSDSNDSEILGVPLTEVDSQSVQQRQIVVQENDTPTEEQSAPKKVARLSADPVAFRDNDVTDTF